jgi:peptide/nickel transport system permease protein
MQRTRLFRWARTYIGSTVGIVLALLVLLASVLAPLLAPYDPASQDLLKGLTGPTWAHPFGTDQLGRDIFSRLLWAGRYSISATAFVLVMSLSLGTIVGLLAGYLGGWAGQLIMRLIDVFMSIPGLILSLAIIGALGPGLENLTLALTIIWWPSYARLAMSKVLTLKSTDYVVAAETLGASQLHIMRKHLMPSLLGSLTVLLSLDVGAVILTIAALGFLGLGIQPPAPEWGTMLVEARPFMQLAPHLVFAPGLAILIVVFGFNSLGEGLDQLLNPWL